MTNDDFFGDILENEENDKLQHNNQNSDNEDIDFNFDEQEEIEEEIEEVKIENKKVEDRYLAKDTYKRTKNDLQDSVAELQGSINSMLKTIDKKPDDMFPDPDLLPSLNIDVEYYDYAKELEIIKIDSKETLECLANLYLSEDLMKTKNVYKIIKDDSSNLAKLNFSISMGQKSLVGCMKQLDMGVNDPLMYQSVTMFMKEIRDNVKMAYDIQRKMKDFYKELKGELQDLNAGPEKITSGDEDNYTIIGDPKMLNNMMDKMKNDPDFLKNMLS